MIRSLSNCGLRVFSVALLLGACVGAQQTALEPPLSYPVVADTGWEVWTGSVAGPYGRPGDGRFHLERVTPQTPDGPVQNSAKYAEAVTLRIKRELDGSFYGTIRYYGLRSFELRVSGCIDDKGQAIFTEQIDPNNAPPLAWHRTPWQFTGALGQDCWQGAVGGTEAFLDITATWR